MSGGGQVGALLRLRWQMVRSGRLQIVLGFAAFGALGLIALAVLTGSTASLGRQTGDNLSASDLLGSNVDRTGEIAVLIPSAMLAFILLCIIAPIVAGGGTELIPESQLVAYPVKVRTLVRLSLVLAPLNVTWYLQVLLLAAATAYAIRGPGGPGLPLVVLLSFLAACTTVGHALGWLLVGLRRTRRGRVTTWALLAVLVGGALWVIVNDRAADLLDASPTVRVLGAQLSAARLEHGGYLIVVAVLLAAALLGYVAAVVAASWALRRPGDVGVDGALSKPLPRRTGDRDDLATLIAIDRASVWRSPPLRRGLLVLGGAAGDRRGDRQPALVVHRAAAPARLVRRRAAVRRQRAVARRLGRGVGLDAAAGPAARAARQGAGRARGDRRRGDARAGGRRPCARAAGPTCSTSCAPSAPRSAAPPSSSPPACACRSRVRTGPSCADRATPRRLRGPWPCTPCAWPS